jgi:transposase
LFFEDESRFGLLTVLRRMLTAKGMKPVAPFLHRFDNLYLFGAFSPITGCSHILEMPHCNASTLQCFLDYVSQQKPQEFKIMILDNGAFHHAKKLNIPNNIALLFLPPYSPELNPAEKMWRYFKDRVSMIAYNNIEMLQNQLSEIIKELNESIVKSICGNRFYKKNYKGVFNV